MLTLLPPSSCLLGVHLLALAAAAPAAGSLRRHRCLCSRLFWRCAVIAPPLCCPSCSCHLATSITCGAWHCLTLFGSCWSPPLCCCSLLRRSALPRQAQKAPLPPPPPALAPALVALLQQGFFQCLPLPQANTSPFPVAGAAAGPWLLPWHPAQRLPTSASSSHHGSASN